MLENTSKVQEAMDCLGDAEGRDAKLSANRVIRQWSFPQVKARADNTPEGSHICRVFFFFLMALRVLTVCSSHVPAPCKARVATQAEATKGLVFFVETARGKDPGRKSPECLPC